MLNVQSFNTTWSHTWNWIEGLKTFKLSKFWSLHTIINHTRFLLLARLSNSTRTCSNLPHHLKMGRKKKSSFFTVHWVFHLNFPTRLLCLLRLFSVWLRGTKPHPSTGRFFFFWQKLFPIFIVEWLMTTENLNRHEWQWKSVKRFSFLSVNFISTFWMLLFSSHNHISK